MDKSDKLKQLEKLMESAGMETGLAAMQSETFQKMAKTGDGGSGNDHPMPSKNKIKTVSSSPPPVQSHAPNSSFKTESALKETRDQLNLFKTALYGLKTRQTDLLEKISQKESTAEIRPVLDYLMNLLTDAGQWQKMMSNPQDLKNQLHEKISILDSFFASYQELRVAIQEILDGISRIGNEQDAKQYSQAILVVDDSLSQRKIIQANLESMNYRLVVEAKDGKEALRVLENHARNPQLPKISLITLDKEMAGLSGTECARVIRHPSFLSKFPIYTSIPIIMITSYVDKATIIEASQAGINDLIKKPIDKKTLEDKIKKYLR